MEWKEKKTIHHKISTKESYKVINCNIFSISNLWFRQAIIRKRKLRFPFLDQTLVYISYLESICSGAHIFFIISNNCDCISLFNFTHIRPMNRKFDFHFTIKARIQHPWYIEEGMKFIKLYLDQAFRYRNLIYQCWNKYDDLYIITLISISLPN